MKIQEKVDFDRDVDGRLAYLQTLGVDCIAVTLPWTGRDTAFDVSTPKGALGFLGMARDKVAAHGMELRTVAAMPGLDAVKQGSPERDREIAIVLNMLQAMGELGIPVFTYSFKFLKSTSLRSAPVKGRGLATYVAFDYDEYLKKPTKPGHAPLGEEAMWDNLSYFLKAVIPTAEKAGVRMALHPDDPPVPPGTPALAGAAHIVSSFADYRKIFEAVPSPSNAMLFCQGCVKEMQGVDVYEGIRAMGSKIAAVHFRNVSGAFPRFHETFVDNGDIDMFRAMQAYRDAGFKGPFSMDHAPSYPGSEVANQAFVIGYMRALIQAVYR